MSIVCDFNSIDPARFVFLIRSKRANSGRSANEVNEVHFARGGPRGMDVVTRMSLFHRNVYESIRFAGLEYFD